MPLFLSSSKFFTEVFVSNYKDEFHWTALANKAKPGRLIDVCAGSI